MTIRSVAHVAISTPDLGRAVAFWTAVGFSEVRRWSWSDLPAADRLTGLQGSAATAVLMNGPGLELELFEFETPGPAPSPAVDRPVSDHGYTHICLHSDDLDADMARLTDAGMRFWAEPQRDPAGRRLVYGRDPDGNVVELVEHQG